MEMVFNNANKEDETEKLIDNGINILLDELILELDKIQETNSLVQLKKLK